VRTAADFGRLARGTGARLEGLEPVVLPDGTEVLSARYSYADPWAAPRLLKRFADDDAHDPLVHAWSRAILAATARARGEDLAGPELSPELERAYARAIHKNVQRQIKFLPEPLETFQSARTTMALGAGDCDCHARLVYSLARSGGLPARMRFFELDDQPVHVVDAIGPDLAWAETTLDARFGEHPHAALRRLSAAGRRRRRPDLRGLAGLMPAHALGMPASAGNAHDTAVALQTRLQDLFLATALAIEKCPGLTVADDARWSSLAIRVVAFNSEDPDGVDAAEGQALAGELAAWGDTLRAAGCAAPVPAPLPTQNQPPPTPSPWPGVVKTVAFTGAAAALAFAGVRLAEGRGAA
jgi:hypothetical protein